MEDQKLENLLNLALSATEEERLKSSILNVGYSAEEKEWDLIVKYTGNLKQYENDRIKVVELYNEYAIITVPENLITKSISGKAGIVGKSMDFTHIDYTMVKTQWKSIKNHCVWQRQYVKTGQMLL